MPITLREIARLAHVSEATASLALNGRRGVNEETRRRVKEIAREKGYLPNAIARRLSKSRSGIIGLVVPDIENPYYGKLVRTVDQCVRRAGYGTVFAVSEEDPGIERAMIRNFLSNKAEGILVAPASVRNDDPSYIGRIESVYGTPCVCVTSRYPGTEACVVMADLEEGSYRLTDYLLGMGHRAVYCLIGDREVVPSASRIAGWRRAFAGHGLAAGDELLCECSRCGFEEAYGVTCRLLGSGKRIDAIMTVNDVMALGVLKALVDRNIRIPGDISVAGFDNVVFSSVSTIPITTVAQDLERMSREAVDMLLRRIRGGVSEPPETVMLPTELIVRASTGKCAHETAP